MRTLNESAIRDHALRCSKVFKGGKFTRVGQDFLDEVAQDVDSLVRELKAKWPSWVHDPVVTDSTFTTGALLEQIQPSLNEAIGRLIQNKVVKQPSCGKTLSRTR
jgi:hypothetical protein